ncbi:hypothetical protein [Asticcacaulis sp. W401b]|uniref:hypothetical protein n=1 Tax=Asticcacaulis sp. W401b TaxID=3388666 RepID=UPI003970BFDD
MKATITATVCMALLVGSAMAQTDDGPIATNVTGIKEQVVRTPVIADAPADDFNRVAWCHGILSGHMDLAERISDVEPLSQEMEKIGASYLRAYEAALTLSKKGEAPEGRKSAEAAREQGFNGWEEARKAPKGQAAGAYVNWSLPGDCERATKALSGHPDIFKEMQTEEEAKIIAEAMKPATERQTLDVLTPQKTSATTAPADPDAAIGSSRTTGKSGKGQSSGNWATGLMNKLGWGKKDGE